MSFDVSAVPANTVHAPLARWVHLAWTQVVSASAVVALSRFASASGTFRTFYAAEDIETLLAEAFLKSGSVAHDGSIHVSTLEKLDIVEIGAPGSLELLDLTGNAVRRLGIDDNIRHAPGPVVEQHLAEALHDRTTVDGIIFNSRCERGRCVTIFERAAAKLSVSSRNPLLAVEGLGQHLHAAGIGIRHRRPLSAASS